MLRPNPFQSLPHCLRYARRRANVDGDTFHVIRTGLMEAPRAVLSDRELFARDDLSPKNIEMSYDPFFEEQNER